MPRARRDAEPGQPVDDAVASGLQEAGELLSRYEHAAQEGDMAALARAQEQLEARFGSVSVRFAAEIPLEDTVTEAVDHRNNLTKQTQTPRYNTDNTE